VTMTNGLVPGATAAASDGAEHVETPVAYDAILLASFGGPEGQDDVIPFLRNVTRGRGIPDERLEEVAHHYRAFGGTSPINRQNRELKAALEAELARRGIDLPVLWGNRNWAPYLADAIVEANERGFENLIARPNLNFFDVTSPSGADLIWSGVISNVIMCLPSAGLKCRALQCTATLRLPTPRKPPKSITAA